MKNGESVSIMAALTAHRNNNRSWRMNSESYNRIISASVAGMAKRQWREIGEA